MSTLNIDETFPKGLLRPELFLGVASSVTARTVGVNLSEAGQPSGAHFAGGRYGRGEVGEFVLIEGQQSLLLGRIAEIHLREPEAPLHPARLRRQQRPGRARTDPAPGLRCHGRPAGNRGRRCLPAPRGSHLRRAASVHRAATASDGARGG